MRPVTVVAVLAACAAAVFAADPNRLPQDEARRYAKVCVDQAANLSDAQLKTEVDPEKACAVRGEGGGAMVVSDKKLAAEVLARAGKEVVPVGQLWFRKWTTVAAGKAVPDARLRIVTVNVDDKDLPMPLFLLGVRKGDKGLELVVYAKDADPLLVLPLMKAEAGQELPIELAWKRGDKDADTLTVNILGKYEAVLPLARQEK